MTADYISMTMTMTKNDKSERDNHGQKTKKKSKSNLRINKVTKNSKNEDDEKKRASGLDVIDSLFSDKKRAKDESELKLQKEKSKKKRRTEVIRSQKTFQRADSGSGWVADGLGGKFNGEGWTGRVQEGQRVFKAHTFNKPNFGESPECPFDCDCCFI